MAGLLLRRGRPTLRSRPSRWMTLCNEPPSSGWCVGMSPVSWSLVDSPAACRRPGIFASVKPPRLIDESAAAMPKSMPAMVPCLRRLGLVSVVTLGQLSRRLPFSCPLAPSVREGLIGLVRALTSAPGGTSCTSGSCRGRCRTCARLAVLVSAPGQVRDLRLLIDGCCVGQRVHPLWRKPSKYAVHQRWSCCECEDLPDRVHGVELRLDEVVGH